MSILAIAALVLSGTVVTPDGKPVGNAVVSAYPHQSMSLAGAHAKPLVSATTNERGTFRLDVSGQGVVDVLISRDGYVPAVVVGALDEPLGTLSLAPSPMIEGVVSANGKGVPRATVLVFGQGTMLSARTDDRGRYRMPDPARWATGMVVDHPDLALTMVSPVPATVALSPGRTITGRVVNERGKPVAGARVAADRPGAPEVTTDEAGRFRLPHTSLYEPRLVARTTDSVGVIAIARGEPTIRLGPSARLSGIVRDAEKRPLAGIAVAIVSDTLQTSASTDAKGMFAFSGLPHAKYRLFADGGPVYEVRSPDDEIVVDRDVTRDLTAKRLPRAEGIVRDESGRPVAGARIAFSGILTPIVSAADGHFSLSAALNRGKFELSATKPGLPPAFGTPSAPGTFVEITMHSGVAVEGTVRGSGGEALAGVAVSPVVDGTALRDSAAPWAVSDEKGRFAVRLLPGVVALDFEKKGFQTRRQGVEVLPQMEPVNVALAKALTLRGRVVTKEGAPAANVPVLAGVPDQITVMTDVDGIFEMNILPTDGLELYYGEAMTRKEVRFPVEDLVLVLPAMRVVRGHVIDAATREPIGRFVVAGVREEGPVEDSTFESATGEFAIELPEETAELRVRADGYAPKNEKAGTPTIELSRGRLLRGTVTGDGGKPLAGVTIAVARSEQQAAQSRQDGTWEVSGLQPDEAARLSFSIEGYVDATRTIGPGAADAEVEVTMRRGIAVSGRVVNAAGAGIPSARVAGLSAAIGAGYPSTETDEKGAFHFGALAPGRYDFTAETMDTPKFKGKLSSVDVEREREITIRVAETATGTITGRVVGIDPTAALRVVQATNDDGDSEMAIVGAGGVFRIERVPAGTVQVFAQAGDGSKMQSSRPQTVELVAGGSANVELSIETPVTLRGRVLRRGTTLAGAKLSFSGARWASTSATAGADGAYAVELAPGEYDVEIRSDERAFPFQQHIIVDSSSTVDFRVEAVSVAVSATAAGAPLAGVTVVAARKGETHALATAVTSEDGTALLEVGADEELTIVGSKSGYANATADSRSSSVTLTMVSAARAIVRLIDAHDGRTLGGFIVAHDFAGRVVAHASEEQVEGDGSVALPLGPGKYRFSGSADEYGSQTVTADVPAEGEVRIALPRGGKIAIRSEQAIRGTVRLVLPDGEPYVRCWCSGIAETRIEGTLTVIDAVSPGVYTLELTPTGGQARRYPVIVKEAETTNILLE